MTREIQNLLCKCFQGVSRFSPEVLDRTRGGGTFMVITSFLAGISQTFARMQASRRRSSANNPQSAQMTSPDLNVNKWQA